jgi:hypothetical protein
VAHNIFNKSYQMEYGNFKFYLGADGVAEKYFEIESWRYLSEYKTCSPSSKMEYDYALLKLKDPISFKEYLPLATPCGRCLMDNNK